MNQPDSARPANVSGPWPYGQQDPVPDYPDSGDRTEPYQELHHAGAVPGDPGPWDITKDPAVPADWPGYGAYTPGPEHCLTGLIPEAEIMHMSCRRPVSWRSCRLPGEPLPRANVPGQQHAGPFRHGWPAGIAWAPKRPAAFTSATRMQLPVMTGISPALRRKPRNNRAFP